MVFSIKGGCHEGALRMPFFLKHRQVELRETMDDPTCDRKSLFRTYDAFQRINRTLAGWRSLYIQFIRPRGQDNNTELSLLDIGCGGADVTRDLCRWANQDGIKIEATALDLDGRALEYILDRDGSDDSMVAERITYRQGHTRELIGESAQYDVVITNHVLHHLTIDELHELCQDTERLLKPNGLAIFNDIHRSDAAYVYFGMATWGQFPGTFIRQDGLRSIRRSYTVNELQGILSDCWRVHAKWPYRVVATYHKS